MIRLGLRRTERGASLVEASIILPMLILLAVGLSEVGFLIIDYVTVTNAAREGVRTGAAAANYDDPVSGTNADDLILESVEEAACNLKFGELISVSIFKADGNGEPVGGLVNVFEPPVPYTLQCGPGNALSCTGVCPGPWPPTVRNRVPPDLDVIGVEVIFSHSGVTGFFPFPTVQWSETAIMQIEPDTRGSQ